MSLTYAIHIASLFSPTIFLLNYFLPKVRVEYPYVVYRIYYCLLNNNDYLDMKGLQVLSTASLDSHQNPGTLHHQSNPPTGPSWCQSNS